MVDVSSVVMTYNLQANLHLLKIPRYLLIRARVNKMSYFKSVLHKLLKKYFLIYEGKVWYIVTMKCFPKDFPLDSIQYVVIILEDVI